MEDLLTDFNTATANEWKARLEKDLKGITFEQLQQTDDNGIVINPFYTIENAQASKALFQHNDWAIAERIIVENEKKANQTALSALQSGASALFFQIKNETCNWSALFEAIELNYIETYVEWGSSHQEQSLKNYLDTNNIKNNAVHWGSDAIAQYFATKENNYQSNIGKLSSEAILHTDGSMYYNAGANSVSQLAYTLAHVQESLHQMNGQLDTLQSIHVKIAVGTAFFEEIAKLRALRQLLALLMEQYQINIPVKVFTVSGSLYKAGADAYSNLLRDTIAGLAAVMGGCDTLCILPFDEKSPKGNDKFSQRMSINQQLLMKEESYLNQIADVAQGSFYIETLTTTFAEKAWAHFKFIETEGGILAFFEKGKLQNEVELQGSQLVQDYQTGKKIWIGLNKYPNATDMPKAITKAAPIEGAINPLEIAVFLNLDK